MAGACCVGASWATLQASSHIYLAADVGNAEAGTDSITLTDAVLNAGRSVTGAATLTPINDPGLPVPLPGTGTDNVEWGATVLAGLPSSASYAFDLGTSTDFLAQHKGIPLETAQQMLALPSAEPDPARPRYILTEPGVGYRLRASDDER